VALLPQEKALLEWALQEDLCGGDLTTEATISPSSMGTARALAKSALVLSGAEVFALAFHLVDPACRVEQFVAEGESCAPGTPLFQIDGPTRSLLKAERTALNFLQRLCGTATLTRKFVDAAAGRVRICDTRKTTPGFRSLERRAVRHGGGFNHRDNLGSAVMIKDNHVAACAGIAQAIEAARAHAPHTCRVEVEVDTLEQFAQALSAGADIIMLDNFSEPDAKVAIAQARGRAQIELSGNLTLQRISEISSWGADILSVGALTHSAAAADISLEIELAGYGAPPLS
jgi:nicotinate-nucleotide pyrophosphorylase (carboxylating)